MKTSLTAASLCALALLAATAVHAQDDVYQCLVLHQSEDIFQDLAAAGTNDVYYQCLATPTFEEYETIEDQQPKNFQLAADDQYVESEYDVPSADYEPCATCECGDYRYGGGCGGGPCSQGYIPMGETWALSDCMNPCCPITVGGWLSAGYHSDNTRQSFVPNDLGAYNDLPDRLNLHQGWLYVEKEAIASCNTCDYGFRFDMLYGTDAQSLQATGNPGAQNRNIGSWDASFDHGIYGFAMPQAYAEVAYGDWSIIGGYFLSLVGWESSLAPQNFFYSHSLTMFNSEPFTHTGILAQYEGFDRITFYSGWTLGWDTAFRQNFGGSNYLGGFGVDLNEFMWFTYMTTIGDFGYRGDNGYNHSLVFEAQLSNRLDYVLQSDYIHHDNSFGTPGLTTEEYGTVHYLFYTLNDELALGGRMEWWSSNRLTGVQQSYYEITGGVNIMPHSNLVIRPEIRYDWTPGNQNVIATNGTPYNNTVFGVDCVFTY